MAHSPDSPWVVIEPPPPTDTHILMEIFADSAVLFEGLKINPLPLLNFLNDQRAVGTGVFVKNFECKFCFRRFMLLHFISQIIKL